MCMMILHKNCQTFWGKKWSLRGFFNILGQSSSKRVQPKSLKFQNVFHDVFFDALGQQGLDHFSYHFPSFPGWDVLGLFIWAMSVAFQQHVASFCFPFRDGHGMYLSRTELFSRPRRDFPRREKTSWCLKDDFPQCLECR